MFSFFLAAMLLGFVFNAAPGAVFSETLRRGLRDGYKPALLVQIGSLVGDATWAALGLTGLALLLDSAQIRYPLTLASALYLAWLGYQSLRDAHRPPQPSDDGQVAAGSAFAAGATLSLTNPQNIVYWAAMGGRWPPSALPSQRRRTWRYSSPASWFLHCSGASSAPVWWTGFAAPLRCSGTA